MVPMDLGPVSLALLEFPQNSSEQLGLQYLQVEGNPQPIDGDPQLPHPLLPQLMLVYLACHAGQYHLLVVVVVIDEVGQSLVGEGQKHQVCQHQTSQRLADPALQIHCPNGL